ncbi:MAG: hypothetical protein HYX42_19835 [Polaromonas sp.]|uniref:hypothetical protein n=1 Tax=Polaromonas sp. TaxID=1869339 RepID=UPI0025CFB821|nr:hypothetical protein [Polaromonas sp.]MBI2728495.1 hypothetical protein [Polaromonas sp.]
MSRNRHSRLITVLIALTSLLFMQLAIAGYACPGTGTKAAEIAAMTKTGMPCAESMDMSMDDTQPNLCHAHCQAGQQSADKYQTPIPPAIDTLPPDLTVQVIPHLFAQAPLQPPHLQRTTAPPLAIRNCCFRL